MMPSAETTEPEDSANEEGAATGSSNNHKSTNGPSSPVNGNARSSDSNYLTVKIKPGSVSRHDFLKKTSLVGVADTVLTFFLFCDCQKPTAEKGINSTLFF